MQQAIKTHTIQSSNGTERKTYFIIDGFRKRNASFPKPPTSWGQLLLLAIIAFGVFTLNGTIAEKNKEYNQRILKTQQLLETRNSLIDRKFKSDCEINKKIGLPLTQACREVLK
jgi:hypothetical protein